MIKIAHRGNLSGSIPELENKPDYILKAIDYGVNVEIDFWILDNEIWFGHDEPLYGPIGLEFFESILDHLWIHCKNLDALVWLKDNYPNSKYFWHQGDDFAITSNGYIWTYPGKDTGKYSILVSLDGSFQNSYNIYGICTDWIIKHDSRR